MASGRCRPRGRRRCSARPSSSRAAARAAGESGRGRGRRRRGRRRGQRGRGKRRGEAAPHPNQLLHGAFAGFFREAVLDRYREFTLSHLEEQVVAFHADAFLAAQPEGSHAFWGDFFQTRLFAHFLLLEHRRVADTFQAPPALLPPRPAT